MNTKKLAKIIKLVVEHELKRQLPGLISEGVAKVLNEQKRLPTKKIVETVEKEVDPFSLANTMLDEIQANPTKKVDTIEPEMRRLSTNPMLNEILNNTKPFQDRGLPPEYDQTSQLDESYKDMDKTISFDANGAQGGLDVIKSQMSAKMGYGDMNPPAAKIGMGVSTGLPGLDRILNRDNSALVKQFRTRK